MPLRHNSAEPSHGADAYTGLVSDAVGSHPQYDDFADEFLDHARNSLYNAHYDRPAAEIDQDRYS